MRSRQAAISFLLSVLISTLRGWAVASSGRRTVSTPSAKSASILSKSTLSPSESRREKEPVTRSRVISFSSSPAASVRFALTVSTPRSTVTSMDSAYTPGRSKRSRTSALPRIASIGMADRTLAVQLAVPKVRRARRSNSTKGSNVASSIEFHLRSQDAPDLDPRVHPRFPSVNLSLNLHIPSGEKYRRADLPAGSAALDRDGSKALDDGGVRLAAALAHGLEAVAAAGALKLVQQLGGQHRAGRAERMAERDGAAVHVGLLQGRTGVRRPGDEHRRERLVDLEGVDVVNLQPGPGQRLLRGGNRPGEHEHRIGARKGQGHDPGARGQPVPPHRVLGGNQQRRGAIGDLRRGRRGDLPALPQRRQPGHLLQRGVPARALVH